ncbi:MAG: type II secretion system protein [Chloroflexi bacterium]|nr:type II secretion system protein [Chloroflexota bacterium]MDA1219926.1 type II secretion system protein [Chloroflexota bacterium]PKB57629.1 MAG: hypothetical protein BZY73_02235 [SAR202 cluster bacterium Casp-Chloro-G3]
MASSIPINKVKPHVRWGLFSDQGLGRRGRRLRLAAADNRGAFLLETVIATMVFAMVGVAVLSGLSTTYNLGAKVEVQSTAENVARNQLEYVFSELYQDHPAAYLNYPDVPAGYTVITTTSDIAPPDPTKIERVNVTVSHNGATIVSVDTIRFNDP